MADLSLRQQAMQYMDAAGLPPTVGNLARIQRMLQSEAYSKDSGGDGGDKGNTSRMDKLSGTTSAPKRPQGSQEQSPQNGPARKPTPNQPEDESLARMIRGDGFREFRNAADTGDSGPDPAAAAQPTDTGDAAAKGGGSAWGIAAALGIPAAAIAAGAAMRGKPKYPAQHSDGVQKILQNEAAMGPDAGAKMPPRATPDVVEVPQPAATDADLGVTEPKRVMRPGDVGVAPEPPPDAPAMKRMMAGDVAERAPSIHPADVTVPPAPPVQMTDPEVVPNENGGNNADYLDTENKLVQEMNQREAQQAVADRETKLREKEMNPKKVQGDLRGDAVKLAVDMENDVGIDLEKFGHDPERIKAMLNSLNPQQLNAVLDVLKRHGHDVTAGGDAAKAIVYAMRGMKGAVK